MVMEKNNFTRPLKFDLEGYPQVAYALQEYFFSLGVYWNGDDGGRFHVANFLYLEYDDEIGRWILTRSGSDCFREDSNKEVPIVQILKERGIIQ